MTDDVMEIQPIEREGAKIMLCFAGGTGTGKTRTAIEFGFGLANYDAKKLGFIDAENRRGRLHANVLPDKFWIGDLYPPFSPERYILAIKQFEKIGVEVLIIDSGSHEWEGAGGCLEISHTSKQGILAAKERHKKFINYALQCPMHIIFCIRAREKSTPVPNTNREKWIDHGIQPIQEKNFMFEMTGSMMMDKAGTERTVIKALPEDIRHALETSNKYLSAKEGKILRDWIDGGKTVDAEVERSRNILQNAAATDGTEVLAKIWKETPPRVQKALGTAFLAVVQQSAKSTDEMKLAKTSSGNALADKFNNLDEDEQLI